MPKYLPGPRWCNQPVFHAETTPEFFGLAKRWVNAVSLFPGVAKT
jgi:hypothetical protein